jgi:LacI family transcriptional regulator
LAATIKDVARLAGVSIKTVSRVVNQEPHVTESVRSRVQQAIQTLEYAPNISARRLVQQRSFVLCILLHTGGVSQSDLIHKILEVGYEYDYDILIQTYFPSLNRSKKKLASLITERRIDGLVTTPPCDTDEFLLDLVRQAQIPLVQITPFNRSAEIPSVSGDDYQGALMMTEHLISLGHRRIAFLAGPRSHRTSIDRLYGYRAALDLHHLEYDERLVVDSEFNFDGGYTAARILLSLEQAPTAIFAGNDEAGLGAIFALTEMGMSVPGQMSVCGFDDTRHAKHVWPGLTSVHYPVNEIAEQALEMLVSTLTGAEPDQNQLVLPVRLVLRGSTAAVDKPA